MSEVRLYRGTLNLTTPHPWTLLVPAGGFCLTLKLHAQRVGAVCESTPPRYSIEQPRQSRANGSVQGSLAHKNLPPPLGLP